MGGGSVKALPTFRYCLCTVAGMSWVIVNRITSPVFG
jgi:hypothetical protein